jgi:hypothetical protein
MSRSRTYALLAKRLRRTFHAGAAEELEYRVILFEEVDFATILAGRLVGIEVEPLAAAVAFGEQSAVDDDLEADPAGHDDFGHPHYLTLKGRAVAAAVILSTRAPQGLQ